MSVIDQKYHTWLTIVQNPCEVEPPGITQALKPHPPHYNPTEVPNPYLPIKPVRNPANQHQPNSSYQLDPTPAASHQISSTHEARIPYSESRGELQRQFAVSQHLQHEYPIGPREFFEADAPLGRVGQFRDASVRAPSFRLHAVKLLQRVSAHRLQRIDRGNAAEVGRPKKVRFAPVVECFEF